MTRRRDRHRPLVDRHGPAEVREGVVGGRAARARGRRRGADARGRRVGRRAGLAGDHAGGGAVDEADVVGAHERDRVGVVDGVTPCGHVDVLLADRHHAGRVAEGIVRRHGTRARRGAIGERRSDRRRRRVGGRAGRHGRQHRLALVGDPTRVERRDRRHRIAVRRRVARRRHRDGLLLHRDRAGGEGEVVVRSLGAGARRRPGGAVGGDIGAIRVRRGAGRLRRQHRGVLEVRQREARRDDAGGARDTARDGDVVGDHGVAVAARVRIASLVPRACHGARRVGRAATTAADVAAAAAEPATAATAGVGAGAAGAADTGSHRAGGGAGRATGQASLATRGLRAATAAVVLRVRLRLGRAARRDEAAARTAVVAVGGAAVGSACATAAAGHELAGGEAAGEVPDAARRAHVGRTAAAGTRASSGAAAVVARRRRRRRLADVDVERRGRCHRQPALHAAAETGRRGRRGELAAARTEEVHRQGRDAGGHGEALSGTRVGVARVATAGRRDANRRGVRLRVGHDRAVRTGGQVGRRRRVGGTRLRRHEVVPGRSRIRRVLPRARGALARGSGPDAVRRLQRQRRARRGRDDRVDGRQHLQRRGGVAVGDGLARGRDRHRLALDRDRARGVRDGVVRRRRAPAAGRRRAAGAGADGVGGHAAGGGRQVRRRGLGIDETDVARRDRRDRIAVGDRRAGRRDHQRLLQDRDRARDVGKRVVGGDGARAVGRRRQGRRGRDGVRGRIAGEPGDRHRGLVLAVDPARVRVRRDGWLGVAVGDGVARGRHRQLLLVDGDAARHVGELVVEGRRTGAARRGCGGDVAQHGVHRAAGRQRVEGVRVLAVRVADVGRRDRRHGIAVGADRARCRDGDRALGDRDRARRVVEPVVGRCRVGAGCRRRRGEGACRRVRRRARRTAHDARRLAVDETRVVRRDRRHGGAVDDRRHARGRHHDGRTLHRDDAVDVGEGVVATGRTRAVRARAGRDGAEVGVGGRAGRERRENRLAVAVLPAGVGRRHGRHGGLAVDARVARGGDRDDRRLDVDVRIDVDEPVVRGRGTGAGRDGAGADGIGDGVRRGAGRLRREGREVLPVGHVRQAEADRGHRRAVEHHRRRGRQHDAALHDGDESAREGERIVGRHGVGARRRRRHPDVRRDGVQRAAGGVADDARVLAVHEAVVARRYRGRCRAVRDRRARGRHDDALALHGDRPGDVRERVVGRRSTRAAGRRPGGDGAGRLVGRRAGRRGGEDRLALAVDPAGVRRRRRCHGGIAVDGRVARRRHVDVLADDRDGAVRVREGVVEGVGTGARRAGDDVDAVGAVVGGAAERHLREHVGVALAVDPADVRRGDARHVGAVGDGRARGGHDDVLLVDRDRAADVAEGVVRRPRAGAGGGRRRAVVAQLRVRRRADRERVDDARGLVVDEAGVGRGDDGNRIAVGAVRVGGRDNGALAVDQHRAARVGERIVGRNRSGAAGGRAGRDGRGRQVRRRARGRRRQHGLALAVDPADVGRRDRRPGVAVGDAGVGCGHVDRLALHRHDAARVREGVVVGGGAGALGDAIGGCRGDVRERRVGGGAGRLRREDAGALEVGERVRRVDHVDGAGERRRGGHLVADRRVAVRGRIGIALEVHGVRDGRSGVRGAATAAVVVAAAAAVVPTAATTAIRRAGGAADRQRAVGSAAAAVGAAQAASRLRAAAAAVVRRVALRLGGSGNADEAAAEAAVVAVRRVAVGATVAATAAGHEYAVGHGVATLAQVGRAAAAGAGAVAATRAIPTRGPRAGRAADLDVEHGARGHRQRARDAAAETASAVAVGAAAGADEIDRRARHTGRHRPALLAAGVGIALPNPTGRNGGDARGVGLGVHDLQTERLGAGRHVR